MQNGVDVSLLECLLRSAFEEESETEVWQFPLELRLDLKLFLEWMRVGQVHMLRVIRMELVEVINTQVLKLLSVERIVNAHPCVLE